MAKNSAAFSKAGTLLWPSQFPGENTEGHKGGLSVWGSSLSQTSLFARPVCAEYSMGTAYCFFAAVWLMVLILGTRQRMRFPQMNRRPWLWIPRLWAPILKRSTYTSLHDWTLTVQSVIICSASCSVRLLLRLNRKSKQGPYPTFLSPNTDHAQYNFFPFFFQMNCNLLDVDLPFMIELHWNVYWNKF